MQEGSKRPLSRDHTDNSSSEHWFETRQRSAKTDSRPGSGPNGLSNFQHSRRSTSLQAFTAHKGQRAEHAGKVLKHRSEPVTHKRINRTLSDTNKRESTLTDSITNNMEDQSDETESLSEYEPVYIVIGYRANRPAPKSEARPQSEVTNCNSFEVNLSDFPELCDVTPTTPKTPITQEQRTCWGPVRSPAFQDSSKATVKDISGHKGQNEKSSQKVRTRSSTIKTDNSLTSVSEAGLVLPDPQGSPATSWATVASQPPKIISKSPVTHDASSQDDMGHLQAEEPNQKKKRKKKKKSKTVCEVEEETGIVMLQQEPPKFEDEEEFPDLSLAFVNSKKAPRSTQNPGIHEREESAQQPENVNKSKMCDGKPFSTVQKKVQQVSQKKSKALVQLDLANMLTVLEQKQQSQKSKPDVKPLTLSVGGALPVVHKDPAVYKKHPRHQERIAHNPLDSTSPLVKKGKQRETPKAKKPSPLKRVILKEREERKQNRLLQERAPTQTISELNDMESHASENLSETSSAQQSHEPLNDLSGTEEVDQTESQDIMTDNIAEENASTPDWNPNVNANRPKIHSRKFREYCSQMLSKDVDECVTTLLKELVRFQDRLYQKDPMKARMKRRLVMGLREVLKHLRLRKVKCVIISPNCERVQSKGGLDEALHTIIDTCREQGVPFVFALSRKALGRCVNKAVPVSLVGIFNYDGAQDYYHKMIELTSQARKTYELMVANLEENSQDQPEVETVKEQDAEHAVEEPEYIKIWKKMLEKDYSHKFLAFEQQFSSLAVNTDLDTALNDHEGS